MNKTLIHAAALAALVTAWPALAQKAGGSGDGVVTITQAKAVNGGVTPGDAPGFPVSITQPGSYRLAGNLTLTDPNVGAIEILAAGVTLDLGGFTVQGPTPARRTRVARGWSAPTRAADRHQPASRWDPDPRARRCATAA